MTNKTIPQQITFKKHATPMIVPPNPWRTSFTVFAPSGFIMGSVLSRKQLVNHIHRWAPRMSLRAINRRLKGDVVVHFGGHAFTRNASGFIYKHPQWDQLIKTLPPSIQIQTDGARFDFDTTRSLQLIEGNKIVRCYVNTFLQHTFEIVDDKDNPELVAAIKRFYKHPTRTADANTGVFAANDEDSPFYQFEVRRIENYISESQALYDTVQALFDKAGYTKQGYRLCDYKTVAGINVQPMFLRRRIMLAMLKHVVIYKPFVLTAEA